MEKKRLLLHACCAPCSGPVIERLSREYSLTVFFYNPNIHGPDESLVRLEEMRRYCRDLGLELIEGPYDTDRFFEIVGPLAGTGEGGERCRQCFRMRFEALCEQAGKIGAEIVASTLTVSPHKDSAQVNSEGARAARKHGISFLEADFKKNDGFRRSCELAGQRGMFRQDYCGCIYSRNERELRKARKQADQTK